MTDLTALFWLVLIVGGAWLMYMATYHPDAYKRLTRNHDERVRRVGGSAIRGGTKAFLWWWKHRR